MRWVEQHTNLGVIDFLRYPGMWPDYWEFEGPGQVDVPADKSLVFRWTRA